MFFVILASIVAVLLVIVTLVLFCRVKIKIFYQNELYIDAYLGFVKFRLVPKEQKEKQKQKKIRTTKKSKVKKQKTPAKTQNETQKSAQNANKKTSEIGDTANFIADIIKKVLQFLGKRARIEVESLELVVSKKEAADTAVQFGLACGAVSTVMALCSEFGSYKINYEKVQVVPDFVTGKSSIAVDISLSSRIIWILECGVKILYNKLISSERTAK